MPSTTSRGAFPYPLGSDAPATLGVNTAIQNLANQIASAGALDSQGTHASRPAAASSNQGLYYWETDTGHLFRSNGSAWFKIDGTPDFIGTTFPTSPFSGQRVVSQLALGDTGRTNLEFTYDASISDASKWVATGGSTIFTTDNNSRSFTANGTLQYPTGVPSITLSWAGWWEVEVEATFTPTVTESYWSAVVINNVQMTLSETSVVDGSTGSFVQRRCKGVWNVGTAGLVAKIGVASSAGGSQNVARRWISAKPVRVTP